ncbi:membrane protein [Caballeronia jiangsuensis]|nr:membrane protein [Caballeronia jiangsuensis]
MENTLQLPGRRTLRMATGTALCLAISFAFDFPIPVIAPVFAVFLLATQNRPLSFRAAAILALVVMLTTGSGLLLVPLLRHYALAGVMLVGVLLFVAFLYGVRGGNNLVATFLVAGVTMISAAGTADFQVGATVVGALVKGLLLALLVSALMHGLFPENANARPPPAARTVSADQAARIALRAALVVMPAYLLAMTDPASYMPIIMKSVSLGRQSCTTTARGAARELIGSTLLGGLLAILFWFALKLSVHLWMFFLWMLLFGLMVGRRLYGIRMTRYPPGVWLNGFITMIILLGQSVQDSIAGKDVYTAFAVRMGLFLAVSLYACLMLQAFDRPRSG